MKSETNKSPELLSRKEKDTIDAEYVLLVN